jgi:hypothetical protein
MHPAQLPMLSANQPPGEQVQRGPHAPRLPAAGPRRLIVYRDLQDKQGAFASAVARPGARAGALVAGQDFIPDGGPP